MLMPNRSYTAGNQFRYGFNGKENDNDVKGTGNQQDYGERIYDTRLGKFLTVDPLFNSYPWYTPYQFAGNKPTRYIDMDGLEEKESFWSRLGTNGFSAFMTLTWDDVYGDDSPVDQFNRTINPVGIVAHGVYGITTGRDLITQQPKSRVTAFTDMGVNGIMFVSGERLFAPNLGSTTHLQKQVSVNTFKTETKVVNELEQGTENLTNQQATRANGGNANAAQSNTATSSTNRGRGTAYEKQNYSTAGEFESGAEGAYSDVVTRKREVPTLKYDNPNPNGRNFIKFDGHFGDLNFVDRKLNVTGYPKSIDQVRRAAEALSQNPGATLRYEVPANKVKAMQELLKKAGQFMNPNISVVGVL